MEYGGIGIEEQLGEAPVKEYSLYNGEVILKYNDVDHIYYLDSEYGRTVVPNVTSVLQVVDKSQVLINWAVKKCIESLEESFHITDNWAVRNYTRAQLASALETARKAHRDFKNKAADIGKMAHNWLEQYGRNRLKGLSHNFAIKHTLPDNPQAQNCIRAALQWISEHNVEPIEIERKVYSREDTMCGTLDWVGMVDGKLSLLDYKSSAGVYNEYRFQTAFYKAAYEEETGRKIEQIFLLRLGKEDGAFESHCYTNSEQINADLTACRAALILHDRIQELKEESRVEAKAKREAKKAAKDAAKEMQNA